LICFRRRHNSFSLTPSATLAGLSDSPFRDSSTFRALPAMARVMLQVQ